MHGIDNIFSSKFLTCGSGSGICLTSDLGNTEGLALDTGAALDWKVGNIGKINQTD